MDGPVGEWENFLFGASHLGANSIAGPNFDLQPASKKERRGVVVLVSSG